MVELGHDAASSGENAIVHRPIAGTPIHVTRTFVPPRDEYLYWLDKALTSHILTNNGPVHQALEDTLRERFNVPHLALMANGTLALQLAIRALNVTGKIITTPFSYVATTSAILWEGCTPVYADIDPSTLCIDPARIEELIDSETSAIMATHVFGTPCDVEAIDRIAKKHGLKVIYDAAHAFDVFHKGQSLLAWGDASTLSFHATKLFHTVEGGAVVLHNDELANDLGLLRSFGHFGDEHFSLGINAKLSEVHAAMGMAILPHMDQIIADRAAVVAGYDNTLRSRVERPTIPAGTRYNHAYYPVLFKDAATRERVQNELAQHKVFPRRYFYPSLDTLPYVNSAACPISNSVADRILCLPLFTDLQEDQVQFISSVVLQAL